jgi:hypothetical protein
MFSRLDFLVPGIFVTLIGFFATAFFFMKEEGKEVSVKVFIIYSVVTILTFVLIGLTGLIAIDSASNFFMGPQAGILVLGIIHVATLYSLNSWSEQDSLWHELVFTLYITMLGALIFLLVFSRFNRQGYALIFTSGFILFLVPFLVVKCFDFMVMIPEEVYPMWYFPAGEVDLEIPEDVMDDESIIVVEFQMARALAEDSELIKSRSKMPLKLEFGRFFPVFLDQYNDRNAGTQIEFFDENKQPYGWNFYIKPKWYQAPRYINPEITIRENGVKENDIIVAERV